MDEPRPKRIFQISASLERHLGGPVAVVSEVRSHLNAKYGSQLIVFGSKNLEIDGLRVPALLNNRYGIPKWFLKKSLVRDIRKADFTLIHGYYLFSTLLIISIAKKSRIAIMPHGSLEEYQQGFSRYRKWIFDQLIKNRLGKRKLHFFVASKPEALCVGQRFPSSEVRIVGLGIPIAKYEAISGRELHSPITLLSFSRIARKKRIDLSIRAVKILRDKGVNVRLEICGQGEKSLLIELQTIVSELGIDAFVKFRGHVDPSTFKEVFQQSDILVLPSENENFAVAVAEALAHDIPTVVSQYVAMHEFVLRNRTGVVLQTLTLDELVASVVNVIENYEEYVRNTNTCKFELDWNYVFPNWISGIEEIMGAPLEY
jgi:glycosyltransferase involved in cell wall biosynthesis